MNRDYKQFPEDDNGEVLWELRCNGDALADSREIDFSAVFTDRKTAREFADSFSVGHRVDLERLEEKTDGGLEWHVIVYLDEVPVHSRICQFEALMEERAAKLGGRTLGWSAIFVPSAEPIPRELWWNYLAGYDGLVGSIRINLALKAYAPVAGYPTLLITGVNYESNPKKPESKLPADKELDFLHGINAKRVELVTSQVAAIYIGGFIHNNTQEDYFYVADATGLESALDEFHRKNCPDRQHFCKTHNDPEWKHYLEFLYPNDATMEHYRAELEKLGVL
jgi:hypothetical protein